MLFKGFIKGNQKEVDVCLYMPDITPSEHIFSAPLYAHFDKFRTTMGSLTMDSQVNMAYQKTGSCNCGNSKKIKPIKYGNKKSSNPIVEQLKDFRTEIGDPCACVLPGTLSIQYSLTPFGFFEQAMNAFSMNLMFDITESDVKIHWRKSIKENNTDVTLGSTNESVIKIDHSSDFLIQFYIVQEENCEIEEPLYIVAFKINEFLDDSIICDDDYSEFSNRIKTHALDDQDQSLLYHYNIGEFATMVSYLNTNTYYHEIQPDGKLSNKEKIQEE